MAITENFIYSGPDHPGELTLFPPSLNSKKAKFEFINASVDAATNLAIGNLCYLSAGTQANDMTAASAVYGDDSREGLLFVVQPDGHSNYFAYTTDYLSNIMPNSSVTLSDYQYPAEAKIKVALLEVGDYVWLLGSTNATFDTTFLHQYVCAASGLVEAVGDPDGVAIDICCHMFTSIATTLNQNWALFRYEGQVAYDKTA